MRTRFCHVWLLLVVVSTAPALCAQTRGERLNLSRLEQAAAALGAGELRRAESLLGAVLVASPRDADALNLLGVLRARQQRGAEAERLFRRALAAEPSTSAHTSTWANCSSWRAGRARRSTCCSPPTGSRRI